MNQIRAGMVNLYPIPHQSQDSILTSHSERSQRTDEELRIVNQREGTTGLVLVPLDAIDPAGCTLEDTAATTHSASATFPYVEISATHPGDDCGRWTSEISFASTKLVPRRLDEGEERAREGEREREREGPKGQ